MSQGYTWPEAITEYLDRLVQRDLNEAGEPGVYLAKEAIYSTLARADGC